MVSWGQVCDPVLGSLRKKFREPVVAHYPRVYLTYLIAGELFCTFSSPVPYSGERIYRTNLSAPFDFRLSLPAPQEDNFFTKNVFDLPVPSYLTISVRKSRKYRLIVRGGIITDRPFVDFFNPSCILCLGEFYDEDTGYQHQNQGTIRDDHEQVEEPPAKARCRQKNSAF